MSVYQKRISLLIIIDLIIVWVSIYSSYFFRFNGDIPEWAFTQFIALSIVSTIVCPLVMYLFKLYNRIWQYASVGEMISIFKAVILSCGISFVIAFIIEWNRVPISIMLRHVETLLLLMGGSRFVWRVFRDKYFKRSLSNNKALIVGAGDCGMLIAKELKYNITSSIYPVSFIDDDPAKHKHQILGIPVIGDSTMIPEAVKELNITEIIIAIPSAPKEKISRIIEICKTTKAKLKIIPKIDDFIQGKVSLKAIRDVEVEDLLGRDPIDVDLEGIANYVENKTVLITGAGGSIGSELCRQIAPFKPLKLLLVGHGENSIYLIDKEMKRRYPETEIISIIADVQDVERIDQIFKKHEPEVVFHAAAHKHVPLMELNPAEAIKNNVFGTKNVADASDRYGAERFVLISTDKAVNPTSIMGTTKRIAEMYIQCLDRTSITKFVAVRFGNVLGSRGSVIPHFKEQIERGGPVTVTHEEMIRYFMTIPESVQLVIQAGALAQGGEIFILDMGKQVKILSLAEDLIRLSGFEPYKDIDIQISGIRPGEKLYEELLTNEEGITSTKHGRIFVGKPTDINRNELIFAMKKLEKVVDKDHTNIRQALKLIVPTFQNVS